MALEGFDYHLRYVLRWQTSQHALPPFYWSLEGVYRWPSDVSKRAHAKSFFTARDDLILAPDAPPTPPFMSVNSPQEACLLYEHGGAISREEDALATVTLDVPVRVEFAAPDSDLLVVRARV